MLIYILDPVTLEKEDVIEDYETCVWTERFIEAGDVQIELGATHQNAVRTRPNTLLLHADSDEPMYIETRDIKDGVITAKGKTIEAFFNERFVGPWSHPGAHPANIIRSLVDNMQTRLGGVYAIPNLRVQAYGSDPTDPTQITHPETLNSIEKAYDVVLGLANKYSLGIAVKRQTNPTSGQLELVFVVRDTNDRTGENDYIRFSPNDDNFVNVDELYSLQDWVDVVVIHPPRFFTHTGRIAETWPPMSYPDKADHGGPTDFQLTSTDNPFDWRIVEITTDDIDTKFLDGRLHDVYTPLFGWPAKWKDLSAAQQTQLLRDEMTARGKDEWHQRQAKQKVSFDGEVPGEITKYGVDYHLGDLVVVEGNFTGGRQTMIVTEHIRANDTSGTRNYPTLSTPLDPYSTATIGGGIT